MPRRISRWPVLYTGNPPDGYLLYQSGPHRIWLADPALEGPIAELIENYSPSSLPPKHILKQDRPATVFIRPETGWVVKVYRSRNPLRRRWNWWFGGRAFWATWAGHLFSRWGVETPLPLAAVSGDDQVGSVLVAPVIKEASLETWMEGTCPRSPSGREMIERLARWTAWMHQMGLYHGDLTPTNIFLPSSESKGFQVIDLDGARWTRGFSSRRGERDLSVLLGYGGMWAQKEGCFRFALAYGREMGWRRSRVRSYFRRVAEKTKGRERRGKYLPPGFELPF